MRAQEIAKLTELAETSSPESTRQRSRHPLESITSIYMDNAR